MSESTFSARLAAAIEAEKKMTRGEWAVTRESGLWIQKVFLSNAITRVSDHEDEARGIVAIRNVFGELVQAIEDADLVMRQVITNNEVGWEVEKCKEWRLQYMEGEQL